MSLGLFTVELELYKKGDTRHATKRHLFANTKIKSIESKKMFDPP